jgi:hypothetical protein
MTKNFFKGLTMKLKISLFTLLVSISTLSEASFNCTVGVSKVLVYGSGDVNIVHQGRNTYTIICNLSKARQNVSITTCAMWTSMLQNIKKEGGKAIFYYPGTGTCATLPTYSSSPVPVYIGNV